MSNLRNDLIKLAHQHPDLREDLLPLIKESSTKKTAGGQTLRDRITGAWRDYATEIRNEMMHMIKADGVTQYRPRITNGVSFGTQQVQMSWSQTSKKQDAMLVMVTGKEIQTKTFMTKNLADADPKAVAAWIWKNTPASYKK